MTDATESEYGSQIGGLLGTDRVRPPVGIEAAAARVIVEPASVEEAGEVVRKCESDAITLAPIGAARTLWEIRRTPVEIGVSLRRLARIVNYEPEDMTVVAEAGLTIGELNGVLAQKRQRLAVDPREPDKATLGASIAAAHAGPLRLSEGTVRDLLIGIRFVGHGGKVIHSGGRVVKNVAGYDLMKVMTGSFGTLGIITEATFKVRPSPERYSLALAAFDRAADAFDAARSLNDALPLSHLEVLSPAVSAGFGHTGRYLLLAGFVGNQHEIDYQRTKHGGLIGDHAEILEGERAQKTYLLLRDKQFWGATLAAQIATKPAALPRALEACAGEFRAHAGSGVAQIFTNEELELEGAREVLGRWRSAACEGGGHLRILAAAPALREGLTFFDEPNQGALKLMRRMKAAFDPAGIFNPGCFVGGI